MINIHKLTNSTPIILNYHNKIYNGILIRIEQDEYSDYVCKLSEENHLFHYDLDDYHLNWTNCTDEYMEENKRINIYKTGPKIYFPITFENLKAKLKSKKIKLLTFVDMWKMKREGLL